MCPSVRQILSVRPTDSVRPSDRCQSELNASLNPKGEQEAAEGGSDASFYNVFFLNNFSLWTLGTWNVLRNLPQKSIWSRCT